MAGKISTVSAEEFIRAWQTSDSIQEVMKKTGLSRTALNARNFTYRKRGVKLKPLIGANNSDWEDLRKLAESLNHTESTNGTDATSRACESPLPKERLT